MSGVKGSASSALTLARFNPPPSQDGAVWSKLHGSNMKCIAQGSSDTDSVQAQITCVPATAVSRDFYVVRGGGGGGANE